MAAQSYKYIEIELPSRPWKKIALVLVVSDNAWPAPASNEIGVGDQMACKVGGEIFFQKEKVGSAKL